MKVRSIIIGLMMAVLFVQADVTNIFDSVISKQVLLGTKISNTDIGTMTIVTATNVTSLEGRTSTWNQASSDSISATGRLTVIEGRTSTWDQASSDGISATGRLVVIEGRTSTWDQASSDSISATGRLVVIEGRTSTWDLASSDGISATGRLTVIEGRTSTWDQASSDGISATGRLVVIEGRTSTWNQASSDSISATGRLVVIEGRTSTWNQASSDNVIQDEKITTIVGVIATQVTYIVTGTNPTLSAISQFASFVFYQTNHSTLAISPAMLASQQFDLLVIPSEANFSFSFPDGILRQAGVTSQVITNTTGFKDWYTISCTGTNATLGTTSTNVHRSAGQQ